MNVVKYEGWDREYQNRKGEYDKVFERCMSSNHIEDVSFPDFGRKYSIPIANATDGLHFSLKAYNIGPGDEVLVSDFSWISTSSCILMSGATPVFCDIDLDTYSLSLDSVKRMTSPKTKALIYTHLFGNMADVRPILDYCKENNIIFIEDAAQAFGSCYEWQQAGTIGDCSIFSFNSTKVIAGINGGGLFLTDDKDTANHVSKISRHGNNEILGYNSRMYLLNTEIIKLRLRYLNQYISSRQKVAKIYDEELRNDVIVQDSHNGHTYHKYVIRFDHKDDRDRVWKQTGFKVHYPMTLSNSPIYKDVEYRKDNCINSDIAADTVMSLPIHPFLTDNEIDSVINHLLISN